jgi:hypothetical protein
MYKSYHFGVKNGHKSKTPEGSDPVEVALILKLLRSNTLVPKMSDKI